MKKNLFIIYKKYCDLNKKMSERLLSDKIIADYSKKCTDQLLQLFNLVKLVFKLHHKKINHLEDVLTSIGNGLQEHLGIADLYLNFVKPMFEYLSNSLLPKENMSNNLPPKQVYVLMQISIIMILKHLNNIEKTCCDQSLEFRKELQKFYDNLDITLLNKCVVAISNDLRLNSTIKITNVQIPSQMLGIYTTFFKSMLENKVFVDSLGYLNSIDQNIKKITNSVSFGSMRLDLKVPNFEIPAEVQDEIPFVDLGVQFDGGDFIKYLIDNNSTQCRKASSIQNPNQLSPLDRNCFEGIEKIVQKMTDSIKNIVNDENVLEEDKKKRVEEEIQPLIVNLLDDLKNINIIAQDYVSDTYNQMDQLVNKTLSSINPEIVDMEQYAYDSLEQLAKLTRFIKRIDQYCLFLDEKIKEHYELRHELYIAHLIEKSILKYAPEAIIKSEQFLISFFKVDWLSFFFKFASNNLFSWFEPFNNMFDKNYMVVLGSINTRVVTQFLLANDDDEHFYNNKQIKQQTEKEFYDSLEPSLGTFLKFVIHKLIKIGNSIDKNQTHTTLSMNSKDKMVLSKSKPEQKHVMCFSNIAQSNRSLNVILFSCDFIILSTLIKCSLEQKPETMNEFFTYLNNETTESLTNIVYVRWLLWSSVFFGTLVGNDWINCSIRLDKNKYSMLSSALKKHVEFSKLQNISCNENIITVELVQANQAVRALVNSNKLKTHPVDKYPNLNDFLTFEQSDYMLQHSPNFYSQENEFYKVLQSKLVLLNKFGGVLSSTEIFYFDKSQSQFGLVNIEKKNFQILLD
jgi:hypothetical protein